jgi:hypothetical protein
MGEAGEAGEVVGEVAEVAGEVAEEAVQEAVVETQGVAVKPPCRTHLKARSDV